MLPGSDSLDFGGPFPEPLGENPEVDAGIAFAHVAPLGDPDTIAVAIRTSDYLFVGPLHGPRFDSIRVASLHRQGPRPDLLEKVIADPASIGPDSV